MSTTYRLQLSAFQLNLMVNLCAWQAEHELFKLSTAVRKNRLVNDKQKLLAQMAVEASLYSETIHDLALLAQQNKDADVVDIWLADECYDWILLRMCGYAVDDKNKDEPDSFWANRKVAGTEDPLAEYRKVLDILSEPDKTDIGVSQTTNLQTMEIRGPHVEQ